MASTDLLNSDRGVPLRLYYKLEPEQTADAEVISRASLAFVAGVKELAYILDPSLNVQVGIEGHQDGSLWEDLLLIAGKVSDEYQTRAMRYNLALAALAWIFAPPMERIRDNWWQPYLEQYLPNPTESEKQSAAHAVAMGGGGKVAQREKQQFYREINRDTAIVGFGANIVRVRPKLLVPRSDFALFSGQTPTIESDLDRTSVAPLRVTILSPVLEISNRRWKFATAQGEFGAVVRDKEFLERIVEGRTSVRMRGGVELDVQLETKERLTNGVWTITERSIVRVDNIIEPPASRQASMFPKDGQ